MSNCKFLKSFEHFACSRKEGIVIPTEYASNLVETVKLTKNAIAKNFLNDLDRLEMIYQLCPNSSYGYNSINHHGLDIPKKMCREILDEYSNNLVKENQNIVVKQK